MLKRLELSYADHQKLVEHCKAKGVQFLSTAFDFDSVRFLSSLNLPVWKIPSGELTNYPYLRMIAQQGQPVILSTGMSTMDEIRQALATLMQHGLTKEQITLMHCNTEYPTPYEDVNLRAMLTMRDEFKVRVGYSDHTQGIEVPIAAVALGAEVIEKHFTLSRTLPGPDHKASLEPAELKAMVAAIRYIEQSLGDGQKRVSPSEAKNIAIARKSIVASRAIRQGELLTEENITAKRPGTGISPMCWNEVIGTQAVRDFAEEEEIVL